MPVRGLYAIINRSSQKPQDLISLAKQYLQGGIDALQFRSKGGLTKEVIDLAEALSFLCRRYSTPLIINDCVDLAKRVGAEGVHLGQEDMRIKEARQILGNNILIGASVSTVVQAKQAEIDGANYLGCGHIHPTITKRKETEPIGLFGLQQVVEAVSIPVVAIGGITAMRIPPIMATGAAGVVLVSYLETHPNPAEGCREIQSILGGIEHEHR